MPSYENRKTPILQFFEKQLKVYINVKNIRKISYLLLKKFYNSINSTDHATAIDSGSDCNRLLLHHRFRFVSYFILLLHHHISEARRNRINRNHRKG
jgi:hypothetical protein